MLSNHARLQSCFLGLCALTSLAACEAAAPDSSPAEVSALRAVPRAPHVVRTRAQVEAAEAAPSSRSPVGAAGTIGPAPQTLRGGNGITYLGGHVMSGPINLYYIWYGDWSTNPGASSILTNFGANIGGSPYWGITTLYDDNFGGHVSNLVKLAKSTTDAYSQGKSLNSDGVWKIVNAAITQGRLPRDTNGVYFVLASKDVAEADVLTGVFCHDNCGWHAFDDVSNIKFSFVGDTDGCPNSCNLPQQGPNYNQGADTMANVIAHELAEAATDPRQDGWQNHVGGEMADMCEAWSKFPPTYTADETGAQADVHIGDRDYLIQPLWLNAGGGFCAMSNEMQAISIGATHTLAIQTDGSLWSWGKNDKGQLGDGNTTDRLTPKMLSAGFAPNGWRWTSVAAGNKFSLALRSDGTLWAWGDRSLGQLGDGVISASPRLTATQIGAAEWAVLRAGDQHVAAIKKNGTLWSWGYNGYGQLGNGDPNNATRAVPVQESSGMTGWSQLSTGAVHTMARQANGVLWSWGWNDWGNLGVGDVSPRTTPAMVNEPSAVSGWTMFDGGFDFSAALASDGTLWSTGRNLYGQLGASGPDHGVTMTKWISPTGWSLLSTGYLHGLAVKKDGTLWSWGSNQSGQLGTGAAVGTSTSTIAQESTKTKSWVAAFARHDTSVAVKSDGAVWGWGDNGSGQLGLGDTASHNTPVLLTWTLSRPAVQISGPDTTNAPPLSSPASIPLTATATGGRITKVEYWSGGTKLTEKTTSPYAYTWTNVTPGTYALTAKAFNALGESTVSAPLVVRVALLSATHSTPPAAVSFTSEGSLDWLNAGLVTASSIDMKNVTTHVITDFMFLQGETSNDLVRDPGTALAMSWSDGSPHKTPFTDVTKPTTAGVKANVTIGNGRFDFNLGGTASESRGASVYLKLVNADATFSFDVEGVKYTNTWSNRSTTPAYRVYRVTYQPSADTADEIKVEAAMGTVLAGGNLTFLGATVH
ncbi:MAG: repeat-containing protein [Myxococcales bacterium]|nr:repeat-containing protein [Myxococcales bacterium]